MRAKDSEWCRYLTVQCQQHVRCRSWRTQKKSHLHAIIHLTLNLEHWLRALQLLQHLGRLDVQVV